MRKKSTMTPYKWFFPFLKKYAWQMILGMVIVTVVAALAVVNPVLSGIIVDRVINGGHFESLALLILLMIGITVFREAIHFGAQMLFEISSQGVLYDMRDKVYRKLLLEDFDFYNKNRTGDLMSRQTGDMEAVRHFVAYVIYNIYEFTLWFVFALFMVFTVNTKLALCMIVVLPFTAVTTYFQSKQVKPAFMKIRERFSSLNTFVQENISGNRVVRAFSKEKYENERFSKENDAYRQSELNASKIWQRYVPIFEFLSTVLTVILMIYGGYLVMNGEMSLGSLVTVNGYLWMLTTPLRFCGWLINDAQRFNASIERIYNTINDEPRIQKPCCAVQRKRFDGSVEFRNVSYRAGGEDIVHDISFKVEKGQRVGIIGSTGAGKSTVMNLLCRFYDASEGDVFVDDINVKNYDLYDLRDNIGMAMQDVFLFSDTIEGNIAYGRPDCSFEKVEWAAKIADADGFIRKMIDGYDTIVGERGVGLSGGQKQRISLARALVKDPAIIILDDTTSAVDMETETHIQRELENIGKDRTIFIIAYRISSIKDADLILVMHNGRIIERGTHETLIAENGYYSAVYRMQYGARGEDSVIAAAEQTPAAHEQAELTGQSAALEQPNDREQSVIKGASDGAQ